MVTKIIDVNQLKKNTASVNTQCLKAAASANRMLSLLKNIFVSRDILVETLFNIHTSSSRVCCTGLCPFLKKDINIIEKVQRNATKICHQ